MWRRDYSEIPPETLITSPCRYLGWGLTHPDVDAPVWKVHLAQNQS